MREILKQNTGVREIVSEQKLKDGVLYRWSDFAFPFDCSGKRYIFNTLTRQCFETDIEVKRAERLTAEEIAADEDKTSLVKGFFLVPENKDECKFYESTVSLLRVYGRKKNGYISYTILPTTACNARCIYCYEEGMKPVTMTDEVIEDTIAFILKTRRPDTELHLAWFGGEPLIGEKIIDRICAALKENGVKFRSSMITNASLLTDDLAEKMLSDWNMKHIQVSLDGTENEYIRRKNYIGSSTGMYKRVLGNIAKLKDIPVILRCNMDEDNIDEVYDFIEELKNALPDRSKIGVDIAPLYGVQADEKGIEVWKKCFAAWDRLKNDGFGIAAGLDATTLRIHRCMADNTYGSIVITPDGLLYNCEHCLPDTSFGNVKDGITDRAYIKGFEKVEKTREMCRGCVFLPECTTFSRCPVVNASCRYSMEQRLLHTLKEAIRKQEAQNETKG